jgi:hypothetical protein
MRTKRRRPIVTMSTTPTFDGSYNLVRSRPTALHASAVVQVDSRQRGLLDG